MGLAGYRDTWHLMSAGESRQAVDFCSSSNMRASSAKTRSYDAEFGESANARALVSQLEEAVGVGGVAAPGTGLDFVETSALDGQISIEISGNLKCRKGSDFESNFEKSWSRATGPPCGRTPQTPRQCLYPCTPHMHPVSQSVDRPSPPTLVPPSTDGEN